MMTKSYRFTNTFDSIAWNFFVDNILYSVSKYVMCIEMCVWQALYYRKEHNLFYLSFQTFLYELFQMTIKFYDLTFNVYLTAQSVQKIIY